MGSYPLANAFEVEHTGLDPTFPNGVAGSHDPNTWG